MKVKIRQEEDYYLVYFLDSRRAIGVNATGAKILDSLFNRGENVDDIITTLSDEFHLSFESVKRDADEFLSQIEQEITPEGFNVIEQCQLNKPLGVELELITSCNLSCRHCIQESHQGISMSTEKAIDILHKLADHQVCEISITGGEPFLHEDLIRVLECCQDYEMALSLVTNGVLIDAAMIKKLASINRLIIVISLDGNEEIHDYIRGAGMFAKTDSALRALLAEGVGVETTCTLNAINIPVYPEVLEYCEKLDIPCNFNLFKPFRDSQRYLIPDPEIFFETIVALLELRKDKRYKIGLSNAAIVSELLGLPPRNECRATQSGLVIDVEGRMLTCPSLVEAGYYKNEELPVFDDNFLETWQNHDIFARFRKNGFNECQARSFIFSNDVRGHDPYGINAFRKYWRER